MPELPKLKQVDIKNLDQWFANLTDNINYDLGKIEGAVPALVKVLTNIDTAPIKYLKDSLDDLVNNMNKAIEQIDQRFRALEAEMKK